MFTKKLFMSGVIALHLLVGIVAVNGQEPSKVIALGKVEIGTISHDVPEITYAFAARSGLNLEIEVVVADGNLVSRISLRQEGELLQTWEGTAEESSHKAKYTFQETGTYVIAVSGIDHTGGIFALNIRETPNEVATPLSVDVPVIASVVRGETKPYLIQADLTDNILISIDINNLTQSVSARLISADEKTIGEIGQDLGGGGFRIPPGSERYVLQVTNGDNGSVPVEFQILVSRSTR